MVTVDSVHRAPGLDHAPIVIDNRMDALGRYSGERSRFAPKIRTKQIALSSRNANHLELTLTHEVGHWLDYTALGDPTESAAEQAAEGKGPLVGWRQAVTKTTAFAQLDKSSVPNREYLMRPREFWARSYAQWIAVRSGDPILLKQLDRIRETSGPRQWNDEDFDAVAAAMDDMMRDLGWI